MLMTWYIRRNKKNFLKLKPQLTLAAAKTDHDRQN